MKRTRLVLVGLALALAAALIPTLAFAAQTTKTYKYVALGDSVTAGYGLPAASSLPHYGLFMSDIAADGVEGSYPMLFGEILSKENCSYNIIAKNLGQPGYTSGSLLSALQGDTQMTPYLQYTLGRYFPNSQELLDVNAEILSSNIADANLVSVETGFNDMSEGMSSSLIEHRDNPLVAVFLEAFLGVLNGNTPNYDAIIEKLQNADITEENVEEFTDIIADMPSDALDSITALISNTKSITEEIERQNPNARIALISMYSPYGNSETVDGVTYDAAYVSQQIIEAVVEVYGSSSDVTIPDIADIQKMAAQFEEDDFEDIIAYLYVELKELENSLDGDDALDDDEKAEELVDSISARLSYILSYDSFGSISEPLIKLANAGMEIIAKRDANVTYVDIFGIPNEDDDDPHPNALGHVAIANYMKEALLPINPVAQVPVYRLYNAATSEHLWTTDYSEYVSLPSYGWTQEDVGWESPEISTVGVYRLYNAGLATHHYTSSKQEADTLVAQYGWSYDNGGEPLFYSASEIDANGNEIAQDGATAVYRLYNGDLSQHHLTQSLNERDTLVSDYGWTAEGISFYAFGI